MAVCCFREQALSADLDSANQQLEFMRGDNEALFSQVAALKAPLQKAAADGRQELQVSTQ